MSRRHGSADAGSRLRGLQQDDRGVVALEFGLVAIPMVALIAGALYGGLNLTAMSGLDAGVQAAARHLRVAPTPEPDDSTVRQIICSSVSNFTKCADILIYVQNGASFAALPPPPIVNNGMLTVFNPGGSGSYVMMRVAFRSTLALTIAGLDGPVLSSTLAFRNE